MSSKHERWIENILNRAGEAEESFKRFIMLLRVQNINATTIYNYMRVLDNFLKWSNMRGVSFKDWDSELAYKFISRLDNPHSRTHYAFAIKRFFDELEYSDMERFKVPKRPRSKLPDVLSEEEVLRLVEVCDSARDRALILVAYESSRRNHEVRGIRIQDVKFDEFGALVTFHSTKSEDATIRLIMSASVLQMVIEHHKDRGNPDAYVFYAQGNQITAERFRQIMYEAARKAGFKRRVYPHLLRHSRIAKLKRENCLTDADIMNITGHTDRRQLDRYGRITMTMTNDKLLEIGGLKPNEKKHDEARICFRCKFVNDPVSKLCKRCGLPLSLEEAMRLDDERKMLAEDVAGLREEMKVLRGLVKQQFREADKT